MGRGRRKEIEYHLPEEKIDELLRNADDKHRRERIGFVKNLYQGDTIPEAADREGRSAATGDRWAEAWNEGGLEALMPNFGGGRPPKLDEDEQDELLERLRAGQPWKSQEIQHLLKEEFGVEYHPDYLGKFLRDLGLSYAKPRPKRPTRPADSEEILDEDSDEPHNKREGDDEDGWVVDDDVCTDGGTVIGFFDASQPQPYDNSRRVWYVDDSHIERPLVKIPSGSPHLNPIENVWDYLKWTMSPIVVQDEEEFHERVKDVFEQVTRRVSFAKKWCEKFLNFQKLS